MMRHILGSFGRSLTWVGLALLVSCGGIQAELEQQILQLADPLEGDTVIDKDDWESLQGTVEELGLAAYASDSTLRVLVLRTLKTKHPDVNFNIWRKPVPTVRRVNVLLETSESMEGYYGRSQFSTNLAELLTSLRSQSRVNKHETSLVTVLGRDDLQTVDISSFRNSLGLGHAPKGNSAQLLLNEMLESLKERTGEGEITVFISDGIMCLPNSIIRDSPGRQANLTLLETSLKPQVREIFEGLNTAGLGVVLYAFKSSFTGTYFTYEDLRQPYSSVERPYYIWCVGSTDLLPKFAAWLEGQKGFKPEERLGFGLSNLMKPDIRYMSRLLMEGRWSTNGKDGIEGLKQNSPMQFAVGIDLSALPGHLTTPAYLKANLKLLSKSGIEPQLTKVLTREEIKQLHWKDLTPNEQKDAYSKYTHFLVFRSEGMMLPRGAATFVLLREKQDGWVRKWTTMDDRIPANNIGKTWAFSHLVEGMKEGYSDKSKHDDRHLLQFRLRFN